MSHASQWPSTRESLLVRVRDSADHQAWMTFVDLYGPPLYRFCTRRGLQESDAGDVAQNVLLAVSRAIQTFRFDPSRGQFRSWLGTITAREINHYCRKLWAAGEGRGGNSPAISEPLDAQVMSEWMAELNAHIFRTALERIQNEFPEEVWHASTLVWIDDRSPHEVAQLLDRPPQWVYKAKFRVLRRLRDEVKFLASDVAIFFRD